MGLAAADSTCKFQNMVAVITGAGSGIGRALTRKIAKNGCRLALADIDSIGLQETIGMLPKSCRAIGYKLDVSDRSSFQEFVKHVVADFGQVDIVINNAGVIRLHSIQNSSYEDYEISLNINVWGVLYGCKEFLPYLRSRPEAWLVNISSGAGIVCHAKYSSYNMSKFAVRALTESLRDELRGTNVAVMCVFPGGVDTNILKSCVHSKDATDDLDALRGTLRQMSSDEAAEAIIKGMIRKKNRVLVGRDVKIMDYVARLFPASYARVLWE